MEKRADRFNEFLLTANKNNKKGGSLGAIFKLIQELTDFENKIQETANAQEMYQNKEVILSFMEQLDKMYDVLFKMARGGVQEIRGERQEVLSEMEEDEEDEEDEEVSERSSEEASKQEVSKDHKPSTMINYPRVPKI
ncbi:MAG: hypothetical protein ACOCUH_02875 [Bacteriovoracia bacterium]